MNGGTAIRRRLLLAALAALAAALWTAHIRDALPPSTIEAFLSHHRVPGAVLAIRGADGTTTLRTFGHAAASSAAPMSASARFPIASLSKPITAAAVRRLVAQGRLRLDDPVFSVLPDLVHADDARYDAITVRHLLQHVSGLGWPGSDPMFEGGRPVGCDRAIKNGLRRRLASEPGREMRYSNVGYCLLGRVVERVAGRAYAEAVRELLHRPAAGDALTLGPPANMTHEGDLLSDAEWRNVGAAGGWFGDAQTLAGLFATDSLDRTIPAQVATPYEDSYYGLGWRVWPRDGTYQLTHYGSLANAFSVAVANPDGSAAVILMNRRPAEAEPAFLALRKLMEKELRLHRVSQAAAGPRAH